MKVAGFVLVCLLALTIGGVVGFLLAEFMDWVTDKFKK